MSQRTTVDWIAVDRFIMGEARIGSRIPGHLRRLCAEIGPRWGGSAAERLAAEHVRASFQAFGLDRARLEEFPVQTWESTGATLAVEGKRGAALTARPALFCPQIETAGPLIDVGFGYDHTLSGISDRLPGAIVLIEPGLEPFSQPLPLTNRLEMLAHMGARAAIAISGMPGRRTQHISGNDWRDGLPGVGPLPLVMVTREDGRSLTALAGAPIRLTVRARLFDATSVNTVAELPGALWPDEQIVLGSHHDTTPDSPGANDNASGTSVVLETARILSAAREARFVPGRTIRFVTFGSEEQALQGSFAFVARHYGPEPRPRLMINLDELATGDMKGVALQLPELRPLVQDALDSMNEGLQCHVMAQFDASGDMFPFALAGIPSGMLWRWRFVGRHPDAAFGHSDTDTIDKVRVRELRDYAGLLSRLLARLSASPPEAWPENRLDPAAIRKQALAQRGTVIRTM